MEVKAKIVNVMISIPEDLKEMVDFVATADLRSRSNLITKVLWEYVRSDEACQIVGLPDKRQVLDSSDRE